MHFTPAFDEVRQADTVVAGRDRRKVDESSESRASKDDKRSMESIQGSKADQKSDSESSTTSYSSSSASSNGSRGRRKKKGEKDRKTKSPERKAKTPPPVRELSPPRKPVSDDFFDKKPAGPTFTFRSRPDEAQEEYLTGYKVRFSFLFWTGQAKKCRRNVPKIHRFRLSCTCTKYYSGPYCLFIHFAVSNDSAYMPYLTL